MVGKTAAPSAKKSGWAVCGHLAVDDVEPLQRSLLRLLVTGGTGVLGWSLRPVAEAAGHELAMPRFVDQVASLQGRERVAHPARGGVGAADRPDPVVAAGTETAWPSAGGIGGVLEVTLVRRNATSDPRWRVGGCDRRRRAQSSIAPSRLRHRTNEEPQSRRKEP